MRNPVRIALLMPIVAFGLSTATPASARVGGGVQDFDAIKLVKFAAN